MSDQSALSSKAAAQLFKDFWGCTTLAEGLKCIEQLKCQFITLGQQFVESGHRTRNNKASVRTNSDSVAAIIEAATNGHDAVIRYWNAQGWFDTPPASVKEALAQIAERSRIGKHDRPFVYVLMHLAHGGFKESLGVTIIDEGIGMDAATMLAGPLTFGSEDKVLDRTQFGSFGQGGASLFGQSEFSIIASRRAGGDNVVFTAVWLDETQAISSYVFLTRPDGQLFSFDIQDLVHADPSHGLAASLSDNKVIFPKQGTIRRQIGMIGLERSYYTTRDYGLYNGLSDRLFDVPGVILLGGDDDPGHLNQRRGRRHVFNALAEGEKFPGYAKDSGPKMIKHIPVLAATAYRNKQPIGSLTLESWVISSWLRKRGQARPEIATPVKDMLEGPSKGGAASRGVLVSYNGHVIARLPSLALFSEAGLRAIAQNLIVHVTLDGLDPKLLRNADLFQSSREALAGWFEAAVKREVTAYLKAQGELKAAAAGMEVPGETTAHGLNLSAEVNKYLSDPIVGRGLGYGRQSSAGGTAPSPDGAEDAPHEGGKHVYPRAAENDRAARRWHSAAPRPIELSDIPSFISIHKRTIVLGETNWLTLHTNARDTLGTSIAWELPDFLTVVDYGTLRNGKLVVSVVCGVGTPQGTVGVIAASLQGEGFELRDERTVEVVSRRAAAQQAGTAASEGGAALRQQASGCPPKPEMCRLAGPDHTMWDQFFSDAGDSRLAAFNYHLKKEENILRVGMHTQFPPLAEMQDDLSRRYGRVIGEDYMMRCTDWMIISAMSVCHNSTLTEYGAQNAAGHELLTDMARGIAISVGLQYRDAGFRNTVLAKKKSGAG